MAKNVIKIINTGESYTVEFKNSFDRDAIESLVAFANTKGGRVFIGLSADGKVRGVTTGKETIQGWINQVKQLTASAIIPDIEIIKVKGKTIVLLSLP